MFIYFVKFIHVLVALSLVGMVLYCLSMKEVVSTKRHLLNKTILCFSPFALLSGTLLIYPKQYTFHTDWIEAAYLLFFLFCVIIAALFLFPKKIRFSWQWRIAYSLLAIILLCIAHDAVNKSTFIFG